MPSPKIDDPAAICLRGVSKRYGDAVALLPLDLNIGEGEFFCLLGPSGCGKTTTLNLLGGFVAPTAGEILLRGRRIDGLPPHRRPVNTVFQSYALFPHMTVRGNVAFGLKMARVPRAEAARRTSAVLARVGLAAFAERFPAQLSGGQQQRVAVARALVNEPSVLLLDEPLGALDLKLRRRLQDELAEIHRSVGTTFVYVTHDQEEAMTLATRIAVMNEGRLEQVGTPEEVYLRPATRFVADFIGHANFVDVVWDGARAVTPGGQAVPVAAVAFAGRPAEATLVVRPENARLLYTEQARALRGRALHTSFLGSHTRVAIAIDGIEELFIASLAGRDPVAARPSGDAVWVTWADGDAVVVDRSR